MRLVLHIGTGKTGTTTVQQTFRRHSSTLLAAGVLYPTQHGFPLMGHEALMCLSGIDPVRMPREFNDVRQLGRIELVRMTDEFWRSIKTEIDATSPEVVVLSYESLISLDAESAATLRSRLEEVSGEIAVVAYVRHPSSHWLAVTQQRVKADHLFNPIGRYHNAISERLATFDAAFDGQVSARAFDRAVMHEGDIVADFLHHYVPGGDSLRSHMVVHSANESMSGEAMCIMQEFRQRVFPDRPGTRTPQSEVLLDTLNAVARQIPQTRPKLRPGLSSTLVANHADELDWLGRRFGMEFPSAVAESDEAIAGLDPTLLESRRLRDLLELPDGAVEHTLHAVLAALASRMS